MMLIHHELSFFNVEEKVLVLFYVVLEVRQTFYNISFHCLSSQLVAGKLFQPTPSFPALQFLDSIEKGSNADKAGLKQNDYVLEVTFLFDLLSYYFLIRIDQWNQCHFNAARRLCESHQTCR